MLFSGLTMLCYFSTSSPGGFAVFSIGVLSIAGVVWWMRRSEDQQAAKHRQQVAPEAPLDAELEKELAASVAAAAAKGAAQDESNSSSASSQYPSELSDFSCEHSVISPSTLGEPEQRIAPTMRYHRSSNSNHSIALSSSDLEEDQSGEIKIAIGQPSESPAAPLSSPAPTVDPSKPSATEFPTAGGTALKISTLSHLSSDIESSKSETSSSDEFALSSASGSQYSDHD
jgi:hypothetical protein